MFHIKNKFYIILLTSLSVIGCANNNPLSSYNNETTTRISKIYSGNLNLAMQEESSDSPLYNMEYGTIQRLQSNYESSNIYFNKAQNIIDIWAASWQSTTSGEAYRTMTSILVNDNVNDYQPRGYEKAFLTTFHALNHLDLNNWANARIEIKRMYQIEEAIQNYNQATYNQAKIDLAKEKSDAKNGYLYDQVSKQYDFSDINSPQVLALKNSYQNAFSHYLAGFVFEALNEPSLARPGYLKAGQLQPNNTLIQGSIDNIDKNIRPKANTTDLLIVQEVGHAPQIRSKEISIPIQLSNVPCMNQITIFYPTLVNDSKNQSLYNFNLDGKNVAPLPMVNVDLMAARSLSDEKTHIIIRNIGAAIRNISAMQALCMQNNSSSLALFGGSVLVLGSLAIDKADERNWNMLPSKININRINLPYGNHSFDITINGVKYTKQINLNQPYQVLVYRILGNQVYFEPQRGMSN